MSIETLNYLMSIIEEQIEDGDYSDETVDAHAELAMAILQKRAN